MESLPWNHKIATLIKIKKNTKITMTVCLFQAAAGKSCEILYDGGSNLGVHTGV